MFLLLAVSSIAQTPTAKPSPKTPNTQTASTQSVDGQDRAQLLQQASAMYRENVMLKMKLNKERLLRLQEQALPLQQERQEMIQELNQSNPGYHWDEGSESMVKNPEPEKPAPAPAPPATK